MSLGHLKNGGWATGLTQITSSMKEAYLGMLRIDELGRKFRYAYAGSTALSAGKLGVAADVNANHINTAMGAAVAAGEIVIDVPITAGTAIAENALAGGVFQVNDGTGEGHSYVIQSNAAATTADASVSIALAEPIQTALVAASEVSLIHSPWRAVVESTTIRPPCGVPLVAVTANYYYWAQTGGLAIVLTRETTGTGIQVEQSATTAGAVDTADTDATEAMCIGHIHGTAGVANEYKPIWLTID